MEMETNRQLPSPDVLISRRTENALGYSFYRKLSHTDRYFQASSRHPPAQRRSLTTI